MRGKPKLGAFGKRRHLARSALGKCTSNLEEVGQAVAAEQHVKPEDVEASFRVVTVAAATRAVPREVATVVEGKGGLVGDERERYEVAERRPKPLEARRAHPRIARKGDGDCQTGARFKRRLRFCRSSRSQPRAKASHLFRDGPRRCELRQHVREFTLRPSGGVPGKVPGKVPGRVPGRVSGGVP